MLNRIFGVVLVPIAGVGGSACDEKLSTLAGPSPNLTPTFSAVQSSIFESTDGAGRTACTQCHTSAGRVPAGGLDLSHDRAYDVLVNAPVVEKAGAIRVVPSDPDNSYLIQKLEGAATIVGRRMPLNGPPYLTDGQVLIIRRWIADGAPRN
jgi:hypothetical protein